MRIAPGGRPRRGTGWHGSGNIFVIVPKGFKPLDYTNLWVAKDDKDASVIIRKEFTFGSRDVDWQVAFEPMAE